MTINRKCFEDYSNLSVHLYIEPAKLKFNCYPDCEWKKYLSIECLLNHKPEQTGTLKRCYGYCYLLFNSGFAGFAGFMVVKEVTAGSTSQVSQCDAISTIFSGY